MLTFNRNYFVLAIFIFLVEVLIALFVHDNFIRPYVGDVLVVILMYCFVKSFLKLSVLTVAVFVLAFSFTIEFLQLFDLIEKLGLENSEIAKCVLGNSFAWIDLMSYVAGIAIILAAEYRFKKTIV